MSAESSEIFGKRPRLADTSTNSVRPQADVTRTHDAGQVVHHHHHQQQQSEQAVNGDEEGAAAARARRFRPRRPHPQSQPHSNVSHRPSDRSTSPQQQQLAVDRPCYEQELALRQVFVCSTIGSGSYGKVVKALGHRNGSPSWVAVKVIESTQRGCDITPQVRREIGILKILHHANVVTLIDSFSAHQRHYIVMEYVDAGHLESFVATNGPCDEDEARPLARQIVSAVVYLHAVGFVHRDIKPGNILVTRAGNSAPTVKLADFGFRQEVDLSAELPV